MPTITAEEWLFREWWTGRGRFKDERPHDPAVRPKELRRGIPRDWWTRLEEQIAKWDSSESAAGKPPLRRRVVPATLRRKAKPGQLSIHFNVREFDCKDGTKVPTVAVPGLTALCRQYLEPMRRKFGVAQVVSGYRHRRYNARIGGARFSQHIYDLTPQSVAADLIFREGTPAQWAAYAREIASELGHGGVGEYQRAGFVHIDNRPYIATWGG